MTSSDVDLIHGLPQAENKVFYPALDGLRAVAVLSVFFYHYFAGQHIPAALGWGWAGVDMFFVLSGFLITGILFDTRNRPRRYRTFYIRRSLRIFPLFYGLFAVLLLTTPWLHWEWKRSMVYWPLYLGNYLSNLIPSTGDHARIFSPVLGHGLELGHFWSLCVEEQFYLIWPFVVYSIRDRVRLRNLCLVVVATMPAIRLIVDLFLTPSMKEARLLFFATPFRMDGLLLGAAIALMLRGPEAERIRRLARPILCAAIIAIGITWTVAVRILHQPLGVGVPPPWLETLGLSYVDLICASVLLLALRPENLAFRCLTVRPLRLLGQMSYGFYVFHMLPLQFYLAATNAICGNRGGPVPALVNGMIAMSGTLLLAFLSFKYYESWFLRWKSRFS